MLQQFPSVSFASWNPSQRGVCLGMVEHKRPRLPASRSYSLRLKITHEKIQTDGPTTSGTFCYGRQRPARRFNSKKQEANPQNVDLPPLLPKQQKKPYPIPLKKIQQNARADKKLAEMGIEKPLEPPKNGLLVPDLIPVAHDVLDAWKILIRGIAQLLHVVPVHACRIPALVELCIQAGVDLPEYPSRRRTVPVRMIGRKVIDRGGFVDKPAKQCIPVVSNSSMVDLDTHRVSERFPTPTELEVPRIAQETIRAYEQVKWGVAKLMRKYSVKACGYCSEVHVGPWGHNAKLCGEFKHQWRDGKHGWQDATVDEVFPPNYVWHVRDPKGPPLRSALKRFYGKAPAVIEMCIQAGAQVPDKYKPMMRLDIVVPESDEAFFVA